MDGTETTPPPRDEFADVRRVANDRALKCLGVRELHLDNLPEGASIVDMPNQVIIP